MLARLAWTGSALLALLTCIDFASAQTCTGPDSANTVLCTVTGPQEGIYVFPKGVSTFTLEYLSSGNGGFANYLNTDFFGTVSNIGGYGAETTGAITLPVLPEGLRYIVGGNGVGWSGEGTDYTTPVTVVGPPRAGDGSSAGSGGGPSALLQYNIALGAGGGSSMCSVGGNALKDGSLTNQLWAGEDGRTVASCTAFNGKGAPATADTPGAGGNFVNTFIGQDGQPDGSGGNGFQVSGQGPAGGGGGGLTGAGGGGTAYGAGGAGNSYAGSGVILQRRSTRSTAPSLRFSYVLPISATITTSLSISTATSTLPTVTETSTSTASSTVVVTSTSQKPLSTCIQVVPSTNVRVVLGQPSTASTIRTVTVVGSPSTSIVAVTSLSPTAACELPASVYPAGCCPAAWVPMQSWLFGRQGRSLDRNVVNLDKRNGLTLTSSTVTGADGPTLVSTSVINTVTTVLSSVPAVTKTVTTMPVLTSTSVTVKEADTTTSTSFSVTTRTTTTVPGTSLTVTSTRTNAGPVTTVTSINTVPTNRCKLQPAFVASQCAQSRGGVDPAYQKRAAAQLKAMKEQQGGRKVVVDCGSAGVYLY